MDRKLAEKEFHDQLRSDQLKQDAAAYKSLTANKKFYCIDSLNRDYVFRKLQEFCPGGTTLDLACGDEEYSFVCAKFGAKTAYGIDISPVAIENCKRLAVQRGLTTKTEYLVMDAEELDFADNFFDLVTCMGVLHHMDFEKVMARIMRVLKPGGRVICTEPLSYNPLIQLYRRLTPHLRTAFELEHLINNAHLAIARKYFRKINTKYFHLATLAAVPFHNTFIFEPWLQVLAWADAALLSLPLIRNLAWMIVFELSEPRK